MDTQAERLMELLKAATPGPWEAHDETGMNDAWWFGFQDPTWGFLSIGETRSGCDETGDRKAEDAALIVAAVNALPALLTERASLLARVDELEVREKELAILIVELLQIIRFGQPGFAGGIHIQRARRVIEGLPEAIAAGEANYRAYCAADPDHVPDGTAESLATCAHMLEEYGPECFPASESGQIHFARAMTDATAAEIRAFLARSLLPDAGEGNE